MLVAELELALLRDEDIAGSELVLQELRQMIRAGAQPVPRIGDAARRFFMPLEPFLTDGPADHKRLGRIARISIEPIWQWICRDLMPAEANAFSDDINRALLAGDGVKVEQMTRALHDRCDPAHERRESRHWSRTKKRAGVFPCRLVRRAPSKT